MKRLTQRLANALKRFFRFEFGLAEILKKKHQNLRRKAFASELHLTFRQLEPRRVLSVNSAFAAGTLTINIVDDGSNTNAALLVNGANFFADADGNQVFDVGETTDLLTSLQQITVNGAAGVGSFAWRGDFSTSNALQNLLVQNVSSATLDANAVLQNSATVSADASITFGSNSILTVNNDLTANVTAVNGQITNNPSASLHVLDTASLSANGINLGLAAGDSIQFGSLTLTSTGSVQIAEDTNGADLIPGTRFIGANTVGSIDLSSDGSIQFNALSSFSADTAIGFQANGLNSDIQIDGLIQSTNGSVNLQSADSILFGSTGSINVSNAGNIVLTANSDALDGSGSDGITMSDGSSIQVAGGTIRLSAENLFGGDITLGQITANTNAGTAIEIRTLGSILDGTAAETANLSATNGAIFLLATNGAIGAGAPAADIDVNAIRLTFNAPGVVQLTDLAGGIAVTGASSAGGGGFLAANSPLTISANVDIGASMVFTAGNSALAGDNLMIDTAAIVTLNSAVAGTLTFEAGDDIVFNTGRIVTTGGGIHSVVLSADLDNAGLGAADGDRGSISQDGTAIVEVTTDNLTANAATGINIDTTVTNLTANNTVSGGIVIRETDGINLTSVLSTGGLVDVSAAGLVNAILVNADGAGSNVTIATTTGGIAVTNVTAANNVVLSATAGDITSGNITGTAGSVGITATNGDVTIGAITAGTTVTIATPLGSINDAQNDAIADITAGGLITLTARDEIAGLAADGRLDLAAGSNVSATSSLGNIAIRGLGALTLTNVSTLAGPIDITAAGLVTATLVNAGGAGSNATIATTTGGIAVTNVTAANNVVLSATAGDITSGNITGTAGSVGITATNGDVTIGAITAGTTVTIATPLGSINDAQNDAIADITAGGLITLTARDEIAGLAADGRLDLAAGSNVSATSSLGNIAIRGLGALTLTNVSTLAGPIDITAAGLVTATLVNAGGAGSNATIATTTGGIAVTNVTAANNVVLSATAGDITSGNITGTAGSVGITATNGDVTIGAITAGTTVTIATPLGSINDAQNDAIADITAGGLITLTARDEIAGLAADGRLDLAAGSNVSATSSLGNIAIRGLGALTLTNVSTLAGPIDITAAGLVTATLVNAGGAGSNATIATTTGGIAVTNVTAANNVVLSATAGDITSGNITGTAGSVGITATNGDVTIGAITAGTTVTIATPLGSINDAQNDAIADITAGGLITLTARDEIAGLAADGRLDLAAGSNVSATSSLGNIAIRGLGALTLTNVSTLAGPIDITAAGLVTATLVNAGGAGSNATIATTTGGIAVTNVTAANNVVLSATAGDITSGNITGTAGSVGITATNGDVTIGAITAGTTVTIATPLGSINDAQNDAIADITAGGLITLTARDEIAGLAADGRLDLAAGSNVSATSNLGNILLRGIGALTLTNVVTLSGFIDVLAQGTITAINVDTTGTDTNLNDVTLVSSAGDIRVGLVQAGPVLGDVIITAQNSIFDNDIGLDGLDIRGNDITLTATTGSIGSTSTNIFIENVNSLEIVGTGNLVASAPIGLIAIDAAITGSTTLTANTAWIQSNGDINIVGAVFTVTNLALIADADNNGVGTLNLDNSLTVVGDLRIEGANIVAADVSIDLTANRLMVYSGQTETLNVTTNQLDATTNGDLVVSATGSIELIDLGAPYQVDHNPVIPPVDRDNVALQTLSNSGFIRLVATGSITVSDDVIAGNDLIQTSTGSITLQANALTASVNIKDTILSDAGAIVIEAFQDINLGGAISPNEAADTDNIPIVTTTTGNITLRADSDGTLSGAGGAITMADGTRVIAGRDTSALYIPGLNGNPSPSSFSLGAAPQLAGLAEIRLFADGTIALGLLQSANVVASAISIQSFNAAITDNTAAETSNLITDGTATLSAALGIGAAAAADIDTTIGTLVATNSTSGNIFVQETNGLIIGGTGVRTLGGNGNINFDVDAGNLAVNSVVTANGAGTVTLNADVGTIDLNAAVSASTGAITVTGDVINQNAGGNITTGGAGTINLIADNGSISMADGTTATTFNGTINYSATNNVMLSQLISTDAAINITADSGWIDEVSAAAMVQGNLLTIDAGRYAHLHNTRVNQLDASVGSNGILNAAAGQVVNANASDRGDDFLNNLLINVPGTQLVGDADPSEFQFASKYSNGYSLFIVNQTALVVNRATAGIVTLSSSPNIYIETRNATNLTIAGDVITRSTTVNEGGIVLVAGRDFSLLASGKLETQVVTGSAFRQTIENIGPGAQYLGAKFYDGGEGSDPNMRSTKNVIQESSRLAETSVRHVNQRVAMQFGFAGEQGFVAIIGYADGGAVGGSNPRAFNVTGEQGILPTNPADQTAISSFPATNPNIAIFTRPDEFTQTFLTENQVLPTNAIVRRSSDFFIFANASQPSVAEIRDLTFQYAPIKNVTSEGSAGGSLLPTDLPQIKVPVPGTFSLPAEIANPIVIRPPEVEFAITVDKSKIVSIYRVEYIDTNSDGQPGMDELPSESSVLESIKKPQVKDDGFEITSASDGTPTQQEIDAKKAELIRDPQRPSGAYAIVEKDPDGKESVIEVFPIRDWEEEAPKSSTELPIVPSNEKPLDEPGAEDKIIPRPMPKDSSSYFSPPGQDNEQRVATMDSAPIDSEVAALRGNSRFASLGLFFGSLWIVRESTKTETTSTNEVLAELGSIGFSSRDRRNRRLRSKLNK